MNIKRTRLPITKQKETYSITVVCYNCGWHSAKRNGFGVAYAGIFEIEKGVAAQYLLHDMKCKSCGIIGHIKPEI